MTDKPVVELSERIRPNIEAAPRVCDEVKRIEAARAADKARIAELMGLLATARDYVYSELQERKVNLAGYPQKWRIEEADLAAIDEALAQQGKEGGV